MVTLPTAIGKGTISKIKLKDTMKNTFLFRGLPNYWMVKSPDSSGDGNTIITSNLSCILRLPDTGPKVSTSVISRRRIVYSVKRFSSMKAMCPPSEQKGYGSFTLTAKLSFYCFVDCSKFVKKKILFQLACRYVDSPILIQRPGVGPVKFDFQFIVLLHCVKPLRISMHSKFVSRFANK